MSTPHGELPSELAALSLGDEEGHAALGLQHLPHDALARVLCYLDLEGIASCLLLCKAMRDACLDDRLWYALCDWKWGASTDVRAWVAPPSPADGSGGACLSPPKTFR